MRRRKAPWTACSGAPGKSGMQIRFDLDHVEKYDVKSCVSGLFGVMKDPETHFGECNVACGKGKRHKIVHDFSTGVTSITEEDCDMPELKLQSCSVFVTVAATTAAPVAETTAAPVSQTTASAAPIVETTTTVKVEPEVPDVVVTTVPTTVRVGGVTVGTNDVGTNDVIVDTAVTAVLGQTINGVVVGNDVITGDGTNGVIVENVDTNVANGDTVSSVVTGTVVDGVISGNIVSGIIIRPAVASVPPEIVTVTADALTIALSVAFALIALLI